MAKTLLRPLRVLLACASVSLTLCACTNEYTRSATAEQYLAPLLGVLPDVAEIGICDGGQYGSDSIAIEFNDDAIAEYRLPRDGSTNATLEWVRSRDERNSSTTDLRGCLIRANVLYPSGSDYLITPEPSGNLKVEVATNIVTNASFDTERRRLSLAAAAVHLAEGNHKGYVSPSKTWNQ
ncbi:hypothetical protein G3A43_07340 [Paraburkholderia aspalathi]|nr:hypothetical protein [Paraburkholderia aspalathi]MBK3780067.1 hypothetical protein [Paraburkholderia aspalathi]